MYAAVRSTFAIAALALMFAADAGLAQATDPSADRPSFKEPGTATLIGVLVPGGGQLYAGKITKGLTLLAVGYGSIVAGTALAVTNCDDIGDYEDGCTKSLTPLYIGYGGYLASWIYGLATAGGDAREVNAKNGYQRRTSIAPIVVASNNRPAYGVSVTMRFGR